MYGIKEASRAASRHVLSRTEELRLHAAYLAGDHAAGQRLVTSFLPALARSARAPGMGKEYAEDLLSVAVQAFMTHLFRYDSTRGWRIWTYMRLPVKHAMSQYASTNRVFFKVAGIDDRVALTHLEEEKKKLGASGRPLAGSEARHIADVFGVSESMVNAFDDDMSIMRPTPIHGRMNAEMIGVDDPERAGGHLDFENRHDHDMLMDRVKAGLLLLGEREREILSRRHKDGPDTLQEIAEDMGVSRERIRQIEGVALRKLRLAIESPGMTAKGNASLVRRYDDATRKRTNSGSKTYVASMTRPGGRRKAKTKAPVKATRHRAAVIVARMHARP